jgi:glucose/arabinose dehydrogenase
MRNKAFLALSILTILILISTLGLSQLMNQHQPATSTSYEEKIAFPKLLFDLPDGICSPKDDKNRLFVVGQRGYINVFENDMNASSTSTFLDIHDQVHMGALLGLAFHPEFAKNGQFYVHYLADNPLRTIIAQWSTMPEKPDEADKNSQKILLEIPQQYDSHGGGQLAFGPDGYLYIAIGDGQPYGDLPENAQNCSTLLGKILRIDVNKPSQDQRYGIPPDNPFAGNSVGYREEMYAWGFRNPWRFSFDPITGLLLAGDVGQNRMEEIDIVQKGKNYGWNILEGTLCLDPSQDCNRTGLEMPIWEYGRDQGNATIGGFVYRGTELPELVGSYIYGDYVSGRIWALKGYEGSNPTNQELLETNLHITSFGVDEKNELYFCADNGRIYTISK